MPPSTTEQSPALRYAIVSDTHLRPGGESSSPWETNLLTNDRARWVLDAVNRSRPDLVLHLGDIVHPVPHQPSYASAAQVAKALFRRLDAPILTLPGNHDVGDKHNPHVPSFTVDQHGLDIYRRWFGATYQSFDLGGVHLVLLNSSVLNSGLPEEGEQRLWLEDDLEEHRGERVHMFSHYPPYIVGPREPSNYDNIDEPARSWLLGLLEKYSVEAFFAGHVHQFGYNRHGCTRIYNLFSTCFVRQDYSEMFRVEPAPEYGRNDAAKLGWCSVGVYPGGVNVTVRRSYGRTLGEGERMDQPELIEPPSRFGGGPSIGVHMRHALAETMELPYNGPIDEFTRKTVRNDYPVLALWETGVNVVRVPLSDLYQSTVIGRFRDLASLGHRFCFFTVGPPTHSDMEALAASRDLVEFLEVILPWEQAHEHMPGILEARDRLQAPVFLANIESSVHREKGGPTFSHYISHGFNVEDTAPLDEFIEDVGAGVDGYTFQVGQGKSPWRQIGGIAGYAERKGFTPLVNVRLSSENPAEYLRDEDYAANRAAESLVAAYAWPEARVFLDTFMDLDRGYFPRIGLYDRRWNPRRGARVLSNLKALLDQGDHVQPLGVQDCDGYSALEFRLNERLCRLLLPAGGRGADYSSLGLEEGARIIDLVQGQAHTVRSPPDPRSQSLLMLED